MPITKDCISPPLEAGQSLLDAKQLPQQVINALEYVSTKLAGKQLHLSLVVVRKDVQLPQSPIRARCPPLMSHPIRSLLNDTTFKKSHSSSSIASQPDTASSTTRGTSSTTSLSRTKWPGLPASPKESLPLSRGRTPQTSPPTTPRTTPPTTPMNSPATHGITLMHASTLNAKAEKVLRQTIAKAEKKFSIGSGWLASPSCPTSSVMKTNDLMRRSLNQNEVLFSSQGITLMSLDHVYTFKSYLQRYARSYSPDDLALAIDELRRLVLAHHGRKITKAYLTQAYDWLTINLAALVDANECYKTLYGGKERAAGIEVQSEVRQSPPPLTTSFASWVSPSARKSLGVARLTSNKKEEACTIADPDMDEKIREDRGPHFRGPTTPNGRDDLTPLTRGEWGLLMVGDGRNEGKRAPVEIF